MIAGDDAAVERELAELFDEISHMPDSELMVLRSAWEDGDSVARERAWRSVKRVIAAQNRAELLDDARARLGIWVNNYLTATAAEYGNFLINAGSGMDAATVRRQALPPLLDAVAATIAADGLAEDERETLLQALAGVQDDD